MIDDDVTVESMTVPKRMNSRGISQFKMEEEKVEGQIHDAWTNQLLIKSQSFHSSNKNMVSFYCGDEWKNIVNEICQDKITIPLEEK